MFNDAVILTKTSICDDKLRLMEAFMAAASDLVSVPDAQVKLFSKTIPVLVASMY